MVPQQTGMRTTITRVAPALALATLGLFLAGCTARASDIKTLRFSAIPDHGQTELKVKFDKVAKYLSERLGVPVEYKSSVDYGASVESFRSGDIQFAWFGGLTGVNARVLVPGAEAVVCGESDKHFKSYFVAHKDTGLKPSKEFPMEMKGKIFTFGSRSSTSGRLMPQYFIKQNTGEAPDVLLQERGLLRVPSQHPQVGRVRPRRGGCGQLRYL